MVTTDEGNLRKERLENILLNYKFRKIKGIFRKVCQSQGKDSENI